MLMLMMMLMVLMMVYHHASLEAKSTLRLPSSMSQFISIFLSQLVGLLLIFFTGSYKSLGL